MKPLTTMMTRTSAHGAFNKPVTPHRFYRVFFTILAIVAIAAYAAFQSRNLIEGPVIALSDSPQNVQHERIVPIAGNAKNIVSLSLDGRSIYTDEHGNFQEGLVLENGYTIMTLTATDRFGRTITLTHPFIYSPQANNK